MGCHCKQSSGVVAVMGTLEWQEPNISIRGSMECHPNWNSNKMDYDFSIMTLYADVDATNQTSPSSQLPASNTQLVLSVKSPDGVKLPTLTDTVLMFFKLLTPHWLTSNPADNNGESPESLKECNVSGKRCQ